MQWQSESQGRLKRAGNGQLPWHQRSAPACQQLGGRQESPMACLHPFTSRTCRCWFHLVLSGTLAFCAKGALEADRFPSPAHAGPSANTGLDRISVRSSLSKSRPCPDGAPRPVAAAPSGTSLQRAVLALQVAQLQPGWCLSSDSDLPQLSRTPGPTRRGGAAPHSAAAGWVLWAATSALWLPWPSSRAPALLKFLDGALD